MGSATPLLPLDARAVLKAATVQARKATRINTAEVSKERPEARLCQLERALKHREGTISE
eukprot:84538-Pleurochrysis_carterae.AAC.3